MKSDPEYKPQEIETRWQKKWEGEKTFSPDLKGAKNPYYTLMMFPYPSAEGLHVGNMYAFTGADVHGRYMRMKGKDVFEPIGLDGFGIHSENFALKVGKHPREQAKVSQQNFYRQLRATGNAYDWTRTLETYDPLYYRWTQWIFVQMFKQGLAYRKKAQVNWCPSCKTVLADEQVLQKIKNQKSKIKNTNQKSKVDEISVGVCERCETEVEKRNLEQWFFKITEYADRLLNGLIQIDWPEKIKIAQRQWIGKSEGTRVKFTVQTDYKYIILHGHKGSPETDFHSWLKGELEKLGSKVDLPHLPGGLNPNIEEQVEFLLNNFEFDEKTVLVTHSLGGVAAMKLLPRLKNKIEKLVMVAPPLKTEFIDKRRPELEKASDWKFDFEKIRTKANKFVVLANTKDDVVPLDQPREIAEKLGAKFEEVEAPVSHFNSTEAPQVLNEAVEYIEVFTTRPDTLFGATFMVLSPEHPIAGSIKDEQVKDYVKSAKKKTEQERIAEGKDKTGVFSGLYAVNPVNSEKIPVWIADYVLMGYGTGAIMAVPAHDERDYEFAKRFDLPIKQVIAPYTVMVGEDAPIKDEEIVCFEAATCILKHWKEPDKYYVVQFKTGQRGFPGGSIEDNETSEEAIRREIFEETGYKNVKSLQHIFEHAYSRGHKSRKNREEECHDSIFVVQLDEGSQAKLSDEKISGGIWASAEDIIKDPSFFSHHKFYLEHLLGNTAYAGPGRLVNSGEWDGIVVPDEMEKVLVSIEEKGYGKREANYHLRDWLISRQRYWGPPIPMIYCQSCADKGLSWFKTDEAKGVDESRSKNQEARKFHDSIFMIHDSSSMAGWYPVPEEDLPVLLPDVDDWRPKGEGASPLANHPEFYEAKCPSCNNPAKRETDVSDTFLDSAWYYLRYLSVGDQISNIKNQKNISKDIKSSQRSDVRGQMSEVPYDIEIVKKWGPIAIYIGGAEHSVLHLLYVRFVSMVLHDLNSSLALPFAEPFPRFFAHGLLIKEQAKMSKSRGNVVVPDEYIAKYGADTLRMYLMFIGQFRDGGDFRDTGIEGMHRFVRRVWKLFANKKFNQDSPETLRMINKTVKEVTQDIEDFSYNTAIAKLMEFYNFISEDPNSWSQDTAVSYLKLFAPFAPHFTEELWETMSTVYGLQSTAKKAVVGSRSTISIHFQDWPAFDEKYLVEDSIVIPIQVNGKRRGEITIDHEQLTINNLVEEKAREVIRIHLEGKEVRKVVYVPGKIINFVI